MVLQSGGGGGFGDPFDRDPELVARDVGDGYVTRDGAARDYGVVVTAEGRLDAAETERLRAQLRKHPS
jgi:N-methylhydantoinase B